MNMNEMKTNDFPSETLTRDWGFPIWFIVCILVCVHGPVDHGSPSLCKFYTTVTTRGEHPRATARTKMFTYTPNTRHESLLLLNSCPRHMRFTTPAMKLSISHMIYRLNIRCKRHTARHIMTHTMMTLWQNVKAIVTMHLPSPLPPIALRLG